MSLLYKYPKKSGYWPVVSKKNCKHLKFIEFGILNLSKGDSFQEETKDKEVVLVLLSGRCTIKCGDKEFRALGKRKDVFSGSAYALYLSPQTVYQVFAQSKLEIAICQAPSDIISEPLLITPKQIKVRSAGRENWRREIQDIVLDNVKAKYLLVGETFNPPGNWSSYPPHKHDEDNFPQEVKLEEIYYYKLSPPQGFGMQRIYTADKELDETYLVENNDTVVIPRGYHPVVAAPGYSLYYLWVLAGKRRKMVSHDDPQHSWVWCQACLT